MTNRYYTKIRHLIQTGRNGLLYIPARGIFGGEVEVGPILTISSVNRAENNTGNLASPLCLSPTPTLSSFS